MSVFLKMDISSYIHKPLYLCRRSWKITKIFISPFKLNTFFIYILYFISLSIAGYGILKSLKPRTESSALRNIDLFFTSVSAATVSSMTVVEMEAFSNAQLLLITLLMLAGGEVFTSMARLHLQALRLARTPRVQSIESVETNSNYNSFLKYDSIRFLGFVVLIYFLVVQFLGIVSVLIYLSLVSSAETVLRNKGIRSSTFAIFSIVSTFASCGFIPTNENMIVFSKNSGLLLILIPQIFLGNTLFPAALRGVISIIGRRFNKSEAKYLLETSGKEIGFQHLFPRLHSLLLLASVLGFLLVGFVLFSSMEWDAAALAGLNTYQKIVGVVFQCANARHSGENIVDLSTLAPAILVFFIAMMYLPPYTSFVPVESDEENSMKFGGKNKKRNKVIENIVFSQISYLAIFIILICITERKSLKEDPLNFYVLNITFEVIRIGPLLIDNSSAYGNVGLSMGYSCDRQLRANPKCVSKWYGFSGKWSDEGKLILIVVMLVGRLKKFNMNGGKAWKLF